MKRTGLIVILVAGLIVGGLVVGWLYYRANPDEWQSFLDEMGGETSASTAPKVAKPNTRGKDGLQASGSIEVEEITISSLTGGMVMDVFANEGQEVTKGDLLLTLDDRAVRAQRESFEANVSQAEAALAAAQAQLQMTVTSPRAEEVAAAEGAVQSAAAQVDIARANLEAIEAAIALGADSTSPSEYELDAAKAQVDMAEGQLAQAQAQLVLVSTGATTPEVNVSIAQVEQAEAALEATEAALRTIEIEIDNASIYSPIEGTVLHRLISAGELATPAAPLFVIANLDDLTLTVFVPEAELGQVALGQQAEVIVDSYEAIFDGTVYHIASAAEFTPRNVQTQEERVHMVFAVKIRLNNSEGLLRPGMPADATFIQESP